MKTKPRKQENKQTRKCDNGAMQTTHFQAKNTFFRLLNTSLVEVLFSSAISPKLQEFFLFNMQYNQVMVYRKQVLPCFFFLPWQIQKSFNTDRFSHLRITGGIINCPRGRNNRQLYILQWFERYFYKKGDFLYKLRILLQS